MDLSEQVQILNRTFPSCFFRLEYKFIPTRRFRFDIALTCCQLAIEIEGGVFIQGRHTRGAGYTKDMEKYNLAALQGWRILRFTPTQLTKPIFLATIKSYLRNFPCSHSATNDVLRLTWGIEE